MLSHYKSESWQSALTTYHQNAFKPYKYISIALALIAIILLLESFQIFQLIDATHIWILHIISGLLMFGAILTWLIAYFTIRYRGFHQVIVPDMLQAISQKSQNSADIKIFPKTDKTIHKDTGLFSRSASTHHTFKVTLTDDSLESRTIYYTKYVVSTGNSAHELFKGFIYQLPNTSNTHYQIRSKQKPRLKGTRFQEIDSLENLTLFVEQEHKTTPNMHKHLRDFEHFYLHLNPKHLYVSVSHLGTFIAVEPKHKALSTTRVTHENLQAVYKHVSDYIQLSFPL